MLEFQNQGLAGKVGSKSLTQEASNWRGFGGQLRIRIAGIGVFQLEKENWFRGELQSWEYSGPIGSGYWLTIFND
jgi:hypothetical protein